MGSLLSYWWMQMDFRLLTLKKWFLPKFPILLVIFGNLWIWRMFSESILVGVSAMASSLLLYRTIKFGKLEKLLVLFLLILFVQQIKVTDIRPLTYLSEQERIVQLRRLNEYPPIKVPFCTKNVFIPLSHWLEERPEILSLYRIQNNLSEALSPNLYFFSNHPNERVGIKENEKFPYVLLPFFVIGLLTLNFRKNW